MKDLDGIVKQLEFLATRDNLEEHTASSVQILAHLTELYHFGHL